MKYHEIKLNSKLLGNINKIEPPNVRALVGCILWWDLVSKIKYSAYNLARSFDPYLRYFDKMSTVDSFREMDVPDEQVIAALIGLGMDPVRARKRIIKREQA